MFALVAWGLVLAASFILLSAGMALAWRLNPRVHVLGPFQVSD